MPADVSVVGFDDHNFGAMWNPALTSYTQKLPGHGERSFRMLFEQIQAKRAGDDAALAGRGGARQAVPASLRTRTATVKSRSRWGVRINHSDCSASISW